jgi:hypothetical protein
MRQCWPRRLIDDIEGGFDLAQVFVESAAQILQAPVVERGEGDGKWLGCCGHRTSMPSEDSRRAESRRAGCAAGLR